MFQLSGFYCMFMKDAAKYTGHSELRAQASFLKGLSNRVAGRENVVK